jgi:hypothetical protein
MQYPIETDQIIGIALASGVFLTVVVVWLALVWRRLELGWRLVESHWHMLRARLKDRGDLLPQLARVTRHRLAMQKESLEILARLRTRSISGRNPPERAAAEAELEAVLGRVLAAAMADPGLAGVTEFETVRSALAECTAQIRRAAAVYNDAVATYNQSTARFPANVLSRRMGAGKAEFFDDGRGTFFETRRDRQGTAVSEGQPQPR